ncbi:MAG TPA: hypothetical protein DIV86_02055 [Alphaproteobacteria bacterium]|nr:hypothetical protein [Alphaproteobacteria bacterium]
MQNTENNNNISRNWLILAVSALALSGLFAVFLVIARSPHISELLPYKDFFKTTLTIHVNLSVLVWLLSFSAFLATNCHCKRAKGSAAIHRNKQDSNSDELLRHFITRNDLFFIGFSTIIFYLCLLATLIIVGSVFDVSAVAYLNNYVPYLDSSIFSFGILLFITSIFLLHAVSCLFAKKLDEYFGLSLIMVFSYFTFLLTYFDLSSQENNNLYNHADYYERLYWGYGHILQFAYTHIMLICWLKMAEILTEKRTDGLTFAINKNCFLFNTVIACGGIAIIAKHSVSSFEYINLYTKHMILFGGVTAIFIFLNNIKNIYAAIKVKEMLHIRNSLIWSIILFLAGGVISLTISGSDTRVPAHYHGSIIGVSLAVIGAVYYYFDQFGYKIRSLRLAKWQPVLYGSGQLIHIIGLAISGGYGALRKSPGVAQSFEGKFYMGLMGMGGLISIIGGLIFVIIILKAVIDNKKI